MNQLEQTVANLPDDCQIIWWKVLKSNIIPLTGKSPIAMTNWLVAYCKRYAVSSYQLQQGLELSLKFCCNTRREIADAIHNPSMLFAADDDYTAWKLEQRDKDMLNRLRKEAEHIG